MEKEIEGEKLRGKESVKMRKNRMRDRKKGGGVRVKFQSVKDGKRN
jgi:hypothetical protein